VSPRRQAPEPSRDERASAAAVLGSRARLLRWYRRRRRDLPWRRSGEPYAIWVAEIMLQQTQVATVLPYYARFLGRFPDAAALARAREEDVLAAWSGLGYYRRARALHRAARLVMERHGGRLPAAVAELRELPGVGRYTAGAIASIAFGHPEPALDGNVRRVLSRLLGRSGRRGGGPAGDGRLWRLAAALVRGPHPGDLNQALMELGALVCTPRQPRCAACPLRHVCRARAAGDPEAYPRPRAAGPTATARVAVAWLLRGERLLLVRPQPGNPFRGSWELPAVSLDGAEPAGAALCRGLVRAHGLEVAAGQPLCRLAHTIVRRRLLVEVFRCRLRRARPAGRPGRRWTPVEGLDSLAVSGATLKIAAAVLRGHGRGRTETPRGRAGRMARP
jgi:A/G-specific adenine glycosylase